MSAQPITPADLAGYFGLAIEYSEDLPPCVCGLLEAGDKPRFIVVNSNQPAFEQQFTIAHELAHYVLHNRRDETPAVWVKVHSWVKFFPKPIARRLRLWLRLFVGRECQADIWAIGLLFRLGNVVTLSEYIAHHPKRRFWYRVVFFVTLCQVAPVLLRRFLGVFVGQDGQAVNG